MALSGGGFGRGRRFAGVLEGLATCAVVFVFVGALLYATSRPSVRTLVDLTPEALYTLTPQTKQVLAQLPQTVEVTAVLGPESEAFANGLVAAQSEAIDYLVTLLREYELASGGRLKLRLLDRFADLGAVETMRLEEGITRSNVVMLKAGTRKRHVFLEELVTINRGFGDAGGLQPAELVSVHGEGPLTSAVLSVMDEKQPVLGVLSGFGAGEITDYDPWDWGYGTLAEAARGQGFEVRALDLVGGQGVPEDVDVVLVAGPRAPLGADVVASLQAHHDAGRGLFLAPDPRVSDPDLDSLLARLGVVRERSLLMTDPQLAQGFSSAQERMHHYIRRFDAQHPISAPISRQGVLARFAFCSGLTRHSGAPPELVLHPLVESRVEVFGDRLGTQGQLGDGRRDATEQTYARVIMVAIDSPTRSVIASGASFLGNPLLGFAEGGPANMDLALGSINWLAERDAALEVRPRELFESRVELTEFEAGTLTLYVLLAMPLAGALLGLIVWWSRRR
ncbi:MAG: hypothetical protein DHS20C15_02440 [Planctomycetota bacterium]|nr:MAG: hypothetical protein DHS20C15_02440 [Planctomycetota bacterium]